VSFYSLFQSLFGSLESCVHAGVCFSLADTWISWAKACLPGMSTMLCSSDATSGGILLFLAFCFDLFSILAFGLTTSVESWPLG
jgi:hypothetical protein